MSDEAAGAASSFISPLRRTAWSAPSRSGVFLPRVAKVPARTARSPAGTQVRMKRLPPHNRSHRPGQSRPRPVGGVSVEQVQSHGDLRSPTRSSWPGWLLHPGSLRERRREPAPSIRPIERSCLVPVPASPGARFVGRLASRLALGPDRPGRTLALRTVTRPRGRSFLWRVPSIDPASPVHPGVHDGRRAFSPQRGDEPS